MSSAPEESLIGHGDDDLSTQEDQSSSHDTTSTQPKDHWTSTAYNASASFVPLLAQEITQWLKPLPTDKILDIGCGDGLLTAQIAKCASSVTGYDASPNLIASARANYSTVQNISWHELDCRYLERHAPLQFAQSPYTKIFSNAALHWILRDASTRISVLRGVHSLLQPGGTFVFEMGGADNAASTHTALLSALVHQQVPIEKAREADPWFFPSEPHMNQLLESVGFQIERSKMEYRPTQLTGGEKGGLEGWVRLMGAQFLDVLDTSEKREEAVKEVCTVLESVLKHEEDGSVWLGYVRLKVVARKPTGPWDTRSEPPMEYQ